MLLRKPMFPGESRARWRSPLRTASPSPSFSRDRARFGLECPAFGYIPGVFAERWCKSRIRTEFRSERRGLRQSHRQRRDRRRFVARRGRERHGIGCIRRFWFGRGRNGARLPGFAVTQRSRRQTDLPSRVFLPNRSGVHLRNRIGRRRCDRANVRSLGWRDIVALGRDWPSLRSALSVVFATLVRSDGHRCPTGESRSVDWAKIPAWRSPH